MNDRLDYSIADVERAVEDMRQSNETNKKLKSDFLAYIDGSLKEEWNTEQGQQTISQLEKFVNGHFQDYINYLDARIDTLSNVVIPALIRIENA